MSIIYNPPHALDTTQRSKDSDDHDLNVFPWSWWSGGGDKNSSFPKFYNGWTQDERNLWTGTPMAPKSFLLSCTSQFQPVWHGVNRLVFFFFAPLYTVFVSFPSSVTSSLSRTTIRNWIPQNLQLWDYKTLAYMYDIVFQSHQFQKSHAMWFIFSHQNW